VTDYLRLPSDSADANAVLERELLTERYGDEAQLQSERFGAPVVLSEVRCLRCGQLGCQDTAGRFVHIASGFCTRFETFQTERPA
jgi:hypothetical protein